jgi:hypothetical protein
MNATYKELLAMIDELKRIRADVDALKVKLAKEITPYKIGCITEVKGYSHTGKQCKITDCSVTIDNYSGSVGISVSGVVLKKDGSESYNTVTWKEWNDEVLKDALKKLKE